MTSFLGAAQSNEKTQAIQAVMTQPDAASSIGAGTLATVMACTAETATYHAAGRTARLSSAARWFRIDAR